jgi:exonuclease SbcC
MVPVRLSLKNFLSYGDSVPPLDFKEFSIACLSGKNGHGKSALIDAMTWALWGKCRVKNKDEVIKRGASESGVEFEFEVEGNLYRILRSIKRGRGSQSTGSLQLQIFDRGSGDFKPLAQDNKARTEVEKVLKMDYDSFICSSFILQGRADEFTKRTPAERKEILGSILELDKYERLARKARELALRSGVEEESLRREENQIGYEIGRKEELLKKLEEVKAKEEELTGELLAAEKSYEALIRELEAINAKMEIYDGLIRDRKETEENSISLDQELNKITAAIERDKEVIAKEGDILEGYEQLEKAREKEKVYSEKLMVYTKLLREGEKLERAITEERYKIEKRVSSLKGKERELQRRLDQVGELIKREKERSNYLMNSKPGQTN